MTARQVVRLGTHSVDLRLYPGAAEELPEMLDALGVTRPAFVIDTAVQALFGNRLTRLHTQRGAIVLAVAAVEAGKTLARVVWMIEQAGNAAGVVAIGGGTIGNLAGTFAHLLGFGVPLVHVPTTLVAAVDASISIRHGLNAPAGKHVLGVHHPPAAILTDPSLFTSLPLTAWRDGAIEAVKAALISGGPDAPQLAGTLTDLATPISDLDRLTRLLGTAIALKTRLLVDDPNETGPALALHYGHTFARAVETHSRYTIRHGPAVTTGILLAARIAETLGLVTTTQRELHSVLAAAACPPAPIPTDTDTHTIIDLMTIDPKQRHTNCRSVPMILPNGTGAAHHPPGALVPVTPVDPHHLAQVLTTLIGVAAP